LTTMLRSAQLNATCASSPISCAPNDATAALHENVSGKGINSAARWRAIDGNLCRFGTRKCLFDSENQKLTAVQNSHSQQFFTASAAAARRFDLTQV
jgi:hypothetical protein